MADERIANAVDRHVGKRVRARRLEVEMSQERLADLLGITFQQVQKYEKGVNRIAAGRLFEIAQALEAPIPYFFEGAGGAIKTGDHGKDQVSEVLATTEGIALVKLFASIKSRKVRQRVVDLVRALSEGGPIP